jgi:hypothetical protein
MDEAKFATTGFPISLRLGTPSVPGEVADGSLDA